MARWTYFERGSHFSEWHRQFDGLAGIDVDFVEVCPECYEPLCFMELAFDKGQAYKATTFIKKISKKCDVPSLLVFYKVENDQIVSFRVKRVHPWSGAIVTIEPSVLVSYLRSLQQSHECKK
jgi:hypothetical protein